MKSKAAWSTALVVFGGLTPVSWGQVPPVPGVPAVPGAPAAAPAAGAAPAAAAPQNIWSFLCMTPEQKQQKKDKFCQSMFGQLINNSLAPVSALTGGVIGQCCPPFRASDLLKPPDSAEGAAAAIKKDEAEAKARRAAVRYLGTVDCRYWPQAKEALINALRADKNECVRLEAALSLGRGCCCSKETMAALILTVTGSDTDGNPPEPSERVRVAAEYALHRCLECYIEVVRPKPGTEKLPPPVTNGVKPNGPKEGPGDTKPKPAPGTVDPTAQKSDLLTTGYYQRVSQVRPDDLISSAREALSSRTRVSSVPPPGSNVDTTSLSAIWGRTMVQPVAGGRPVPEAGQSRGLLSWAMVGAARPATPAGVPVTVTPARETVVTVTPGRAVSTPAPVVRPAAVQKLPAALPPTSGYSPLPAGRPTPASMPQAPTWAPPAAPPTPVSRLITPVQPNPAVRVTPVGHRAGSHPVTASKEELLAALRESLLAERREWAAEQLGRMSNGSRDTAIVRALLSSAGHDTAPMVRVACLSSIRQLRIMDYQLTAVLARLKADGDMRVKEAAAETDRWLQAEAARSQRWPATNAR